jgi:hypothetical protein
MSKVDSVDEIVEKVESLITYLKQERYYGTGGVFFLMRTFLPVAKSTAHTMWLIERSC